MKWHFYTKDEAPFSYDEIVAIEWLDEADVMQDFKDEFECSNDIDLSEFVNYLYEEYSEELIDELADKFMSNSLEAKIAEFYEYPNSGEFDWNEETGKYYDLFIRMVRYLKCDLILNSGQQVHNFNCFLGECWSVNVLSSKLGVNLWRFYSGNGEPAGAQLALDIVDKFMHNGKWHVGFYDIDGTLVTDIASWAENNMLSIKDITPIVWFGMTNTMSKCWSIGEHTSDTFLKDFWDDYFEKALIYICRANEGLGIYYSVWEYGLEYDEGIFNSIKESCPITISSPKEKRINEMYNTIISLYNRHRNSKFPEIQQISC